MALSIGIVGLPNVGKSTLFNALTDAQVLAADYPFATIEPNTGIVPVPDERLNQLAGIYKTDKIVPATVTFVDIAGLVAGASQGEGLGNQFLAHIRSCNAICHLVHAFTGSNMRKSGSTDPKKDIEIINTELALADLQSLQKRLPKLEKEAKSDSKLKPVLNAYGKAKTRLEAGLPLLNSDVKLELLDDLGLLSAKPTIFVFNVDEKDLVNSKRKQELSKVASSAQSIFVCAKLESELRGLDAFERKELLASYGQTDSGLVQLIQTAYATLGLQSFLTAGEKEVRAWTIAKDTTAQEAAGVIHGDMQRGFIAAQIVNYDDLVAAGSISAARAAGKVRTEGKNYIMHEGDVVEFKFNV